MPQSRMSPCTGSMPKETGMRIAIAEIGPMPGSTPTTVPSSTPRRAKARLAGSSAEAKPPPRSMRVSISVPLTQDPDRQIHGEPVDEGNVDHECEADGEDEVADPLLRRVDAGHPHEEGHGREQEADRDEDGQVDEEERELEHDLPRGRFRRGLQGGSAGRLIRGPDSPVEAADSPAEAAAPFPAPVPLMWFRGPASARAAFRALYTAWPARKRPRTMSAMPTIAGKVRGVTMFAVSSMENVAM